MNTNREKVAGGTQLQAKERQRLPANHQKEEEARKDFLTGFQRGMMAFRTER